MMDYMPLALTILITVLASVLEKLFMNRNREGVSAFAYNMISCAAWFAVVIPSMVIRGEYIFTWKAVAGGILYGFLLFMLLYCSYRAMMEGSFSVTKFVACPAFIVPTVYAVFALGEDITAMQMIGILCILIALGLCANPRYSAQPLTLKWGLFAFGLFLANGLIGIFYKVMGGHLDNNEYDILLAIAAMTAMLLFAGILIVQRIRSQKDIVFPKGKKLLLVFANGLCTCSFIRLNLYVSKLLPAAVIFPVSNCAIVILSTLAGLVMFKEKLSKIQILGIIIGIASILAYS